MVDRAGDGRMHGQRPRLVIMVKEPVAGRVKTRLSRDLGAGTATNVYRHMLRAVTLRLAQDERWLTSLSVAPTTALRTSVLPKGIQRLPQSGGNIGVRMQAIFGLTGALPARAPDGPVVIIGTDIPEVHPRHIAQAFKALGRHDIVFGPATDGGFWLVGMRRIPRIIDAFQDVRWSSPETLRDCLDGLGAYRVATVSMLSDVDEICDLRRLGGLAGRRILGAARTS